MSGQTPFIFLYYIIWRIRSAQSCRGDGRVAKQRTPKPCQSVSGCFFVDVGNGNFVIFVYSYGFLNKNPLILAEKAGFKVKTGAKRRRLVDFHLLNSASCTKFSSPSKNREFITIYGI